MAVIDDVVTRGASGVLEIEGNPSGRIYLDGGRIAYARASWVPSLAARLRVIVPSLVGEELPPSRDADDAAVAELVVRRGYLSMTSLQELIRSVVVDAFLVLAIPLAEDCPVAAIRFTPTRTYWTGLFPRFGVDQVRAEAVARAGQMAEYGLAPTTAVAPRDLAAPAAYLTREQWAVACQIGDRVSARELAMRRGASLSDTMHCLGSLVRAGLCVPVRVDRAHRVPAQGQARPATHAPAPPEEALPAREAREYGWSRRRLAQMPPPSADVLRQVLTGLRRLT
jgi:hypothetical protein